MKRKTVLFAAAAAAAALAGACSRTKVPPGQETHWLQGPLADLSSMTLPPANEHFFHLGKILVDEKNDAVLDANKKDYFVPAIDQETILTRNAAAAKYALDLLEAAFPDALGGPTAYPGAVDVGAPSVETVDQYVDDLKKGDASDRSDWAKEHPGKAYPFQPENYRKLRADLIARMKGYDVLVLRYVHVGPDR
ncbi:MAG TPA: hypothetical protein VNH15_03235 [Elusimicrobiota bacterium]|nr:hypothetical protein [Elusimicrobiota bacterium]